MDSGLQDLHFHEIDVFARRVASPYQCGGFENIPATAVARSAATAAPSSRGVA
jgi:hypothetical protein